MSVRFVRLVAVILALVAPTTLKAKLTSGAVSGTVMDSASRSPLGGATVFVIHVPTMTRIEVRAGEDGRFYVANLRPGGPYTVGARVMGYGVRQKTNVDVKLGDATLVPFALTTAAV